MATGYTLDELEKRIGYKFKNKALLKQAVTHSSYANEQKIRRNADYERLEFLGDSVLSLIVSEYLFKKYQAKIKNLNSMMETASDV